MTPDERSAFQADALGQDLRRVRRRTDRAPRRDGSARQGEGPHPAEPAAERVCENLLGRGMIQ